MKFKTIKDSTLYLQLVELYEEGKKANYAAEQWLINRFGKLPRYLPPDGVLWGGVGYVQMVQAKRGWKQIDAKQRLYSPYWKADIKSLEGLPMVLKATLHEMLSYGRYPTPKGINTMPDIILGDGYALISVPDRVTEYVALPDMEEILVSEFNKLADEAEEWHESIRKAAIGDLKNINDELIFSEGGDKIG